MPNIDYPYEFSAQALLDKGGAVFNPKHPDFGALGNAGNDTTAQGDTFTAAGVEGGAVGYPQGEYRTTAGLIVPAGVTAKGVGRSSIISTTTASTHLLIMPNAGAVLREIALSGIAGGNVLDNCATHIYGAGASNILLQDTEAFGMRGIAHLITAGASYVDLVRTWVHDQSHRDTDINGSCVGLYSGAQYNRVLFGRFEGGINTELAVLCQFDSLKNLVVGCLAKGFASYGLIDYDNTHQSTYSIFALNRFEDIGSGGFGAIAGAKGAGFYSVGTGLWMLIGNQFKNTNIATLVETLAPGAIGVNAPFSPWLALGNVVADANWYGAIIVSSADAIGVLSETVIFEALKDAINIKGSSHVSVRGGSVTMLTAVPITKRAVMVNLTPGGGSYNYISIDGVHIRGSNRAIETANTHLFRISGSVISEVDGTSIRPTLGSDGTIYGNICDSTANATAPALDIVSLKNTTFSSNVFKSTSTTCITTSGDCSGSRFDRSNVLVGMDMNNVDNVGTGMVFELFGTAPPSLRTHQVGDRVINSNPTIGSPRSWVCVVAGIPGVWVSEGVVGTAVDPAPKLTLSGTWAKYNATDERHVVFSGTPNATYIQTPNNGNLAITTDLCVKAKAKLRNWAPASPITQVFASKAGTIGQSSWDFFVENTSGKLVFRRFPLGSVSGVEYYRSTVGTGLAANTTKWVAATYQSNDGSGNHVVKFWTSPDNVTWTQLGATVTTAGVAALFAGTEPLAIGGTTYGLNPVFGNVYRVDVLAGGLAGTLKATFDPASSAVDGATTVVASMGETYTITGAVVYEELPRAIRDTHGRIRLQGQLKNGSTGAGTNICALPYPTNVTQYFSCVTDTNGSVARVHTDPDTGYLVLDYAPSAGLLSLDEISYQAAA